MLTNETDIAALGAPAEAAEIAAHACELDKKSVFLDGLSERLGALGVSCTADDTELMLDEVRQRFKSVLGKPCPKAVKNWIRGITPSSVNRQNNYELCMALEMDHQQTADFFRRYFLTLPWSCKSRTDAVFLYCIYHSKPCSAAVRMLDEAKSFADREIARTATAQIFQTILATDDDESFMQYLSAHCFGKEQQFKTARQMIFTETELVKERILSDGYIEYSSPDRLNSIILSELLGFKYQLDRDGHFELELPKRYTESLPNDVSFGKVMRGETASYETLRKTYMLLHFYNFYSEAINSEETIVSNFRDFKSGLDEQLELCGFAPTYSQHPFDYILLASANTLEPIVTFHSVNERN